MRQAVGTPCPLSEEARGGGGDIGTRLRRLQGTSERIWKGRHFSLRPEIAAQKNGINPPPRPDRATSGSSRTEFEPDRTRLFDETCRALRTAVEYLP